MTPPRTKRPSILMFICVCLLISGAIRVGSVSVAFANAETEPGEAMDFDAQTSELSVLIEDLRLRGEALDAREAELDALKQKIEAARADLRTELANLEKTEKSLLQTIDRVQTAAASDVAGLTKVYESMKPKDAALLFEQMTPSFAAGFLAEMTPNSAAGILAGLTSEKAYAISVFLAGRNTDAAQN